MDHSKQIIYTETNLHHSLHVDGFVFTSLSEPTNVFNAIVIRNPTNCDCSSPKLAFSNKSLDEHIDYIKKHNIKKAVIIAEDISFITECQTLEMIKIIPAKTAQSMFNYSPLYKMKNISFLDCPTVDECSGKKLSTVIDCSRIHGLRELWVRDEGMQNFYHLESLEILHILNRKKVLNLEKISTNTNLTKLCCMFCGFHSLSGIENLHKLQCLELSYCRSLYDISGLSEISDVLLTLDIENCPKITDFSVLTTLENLEILSLFGTNELPNLSFLENTKKIKIFCFSINVGDGNLSPCLKLPYVYCKKNRKHYNLKDCNLPKNLP